jgi:threonine/homoserine/homoserine lactone efflux protein
MPGSASSLFFAYLAVTTVLVLTPGVGTTFLVSTVIDRGMRPGYLTALGMVLGAATHALLAAIGTTALLRVFPASLSWIAVIGGGYIIWLGARGITRAVRQATPDRGSVPTDPGRHRQVATGYFIALGNAPLPLFYLVVVPQYVPTGVERLTGVLFLSVVHLLMAGTWMATVVRLVGHGADVLRRPRVYITLQVLAGLALIWLGGRSISQAL